jgi:hypothetical protein
LKVDDCISHCQSDSVYRAAAKEQNAPDDILHGSEKESLRKEKEKQSLKKQEDCTNERVPRNRVE